MRRLLMFVALLLLSVWGTMLLVRHPGSLWLMMDAYVIEMPMWFALLCIVFLVGIVMTILGGIAWIRALPIRWHAWREARREHRLDRYQSEVMLALHEERYDTAWHQVKKMVAAHGDRLSAWVHYAEIAKRRHDVSSFSHAIRMMKACKDGASCGVRIMEVSAMMQENQIDAVSTLLRDLLTDYPTHPAVLRLAKSWYTSQHAVEEMIRYLPTFYKAKIIEKSDYPSEEAKWYAAMLRDVATKNGVIELAWSRVPSRVQAHPDVLHTYLLLIFAETKRSDPRRLAEVTRTAATLIQRHLKQAWHDGLMSFYIHLPVEDDEKELARLNNWLKRYVDQPLLCLGLANVCVRLKLWGKAKTYFESCLSSNYYNGVIVPYVDLLLSLGDKDKAMLVYQEAVLFYDRETTQ